MGTHEIRAYYDAEIDLLMVELPHGNVPPADSERLARDVFLDVEPEGAPLVLEVLRASRHYPPEWLRAIAAAPDEPVPAETAGAPPEPAATWRVGPRSVRATRKPALAVR